MKFSIICYIMYLCCSINMYVESTRKKMFNVFIVNPYMTVYVTSGSDRWRQGQVVYVPDIIGTYLLWQFGQ